MDKDKLDITEEELEFACKMVLKAIVKTDLHPLHFGKALMSLLTSGFADGKMDDATLDRVVERIRSETIEKREIREKRDKEK